MPQSMSTTVAVSRCRAALARASRAACALAVTAAVAAALSPSRSQAQPAPVDPGTEVPAILSVTSDPPGALVVLQGEHTIRGRTPFSVSRGLQGRYEVHAYAPGYEEWRSTLYLDPTTSRTLSIELSSRSRLKATLRSMIFPGWGQHYTDQRSKALLFAATELAALGWMGVEQIEYRDKVADFEVAERNYLDAKEVDEIQRLYAEMERRREAADEKFDDRRTALYMAGAIWTVNVLDMILFYPSSSTGLYSQVGSGGELYAGFRLEF